MDDKNLKIYIEAVDRASGPLKNIGDAVEKTGSSLSGGFAKGVSIAGDALKTLALVTTTAVAAGGVLLAKTAIANASQFEGYETSLKVMLGSAEKAKARMKELADFAQATPFELPQVVELGNQLQAIGRYSRENMTTLGDLASAAGKPIEQVTGAFAKLATGQKGIAVDMFRDLLISTDDWTKATGKGISKTGELMATTEEMMKALPKILKDKGFSGMMDEQSKTFAGKMSNLSDAWNKLLRDAGAKLLPILKPIVDKIIEFVSSINIDDIIKKISSAFDWLKTQLQPIITWFSEDGERAKAVLIGIGIAIMAFVVPALVSAVVAAAPVIAVFAAIAAAVGLLYYAWTNNFLGIQDIVKAVFDWIQQAIPNVINFFQNLGTGIKAVFDFVVGVLKFVWDYYSFIFTSMMNVASFVWSVISSVFNVGVGVIKWVVEQIGKFLAPVFDPIKSAASNVWNFVTDIFNKLKGFIGGIVGGIQNSGGGIFDGVKSGLKEGINFVIRMLNGAINNINNMIISNLNKIPGVNINKIGTIPQLAVGTNYVPKDMLAVIHEGEAVVPKKYNPNAGGNAFGLGGGNTFVFNITGSDPMEIARQVQNIFTRNSQLTNIGLNNTF